MCTWYFLVSALLQISIKDCTSEIHKVIIKAEHNHFHGDLLLCLHLSMMDKCKYYLVVVVVIRRKGDREIIGQVTVSKRGPLNWLS